jgi:anti-anti-sigma factor
MELAITVVVEAGNRSVLSLNGSLDLATRDLLKEHAAAALSAQQELVLDLSEVTFFDSSGLGALVEVAGDAQDAGAPFALRNPSDRVMRVLTIAGLTDAWPIENPSDSSG